MKSSLTKDAVAITTSKVITISISLATSMLLARFRSLEEYGTYSQILLVLNLVDAVIMMGLPSSINYFLAKAENIEEQQKFMSVYYTLSGIMSIFVGAVLLFSTPLIIKYFNNPMISSLWYLMAFYPWAITVINSISNVLVVYHKTTNLMIFNVTYSMVMLAIIVVVQLLGWGFSAYMGIYMITLMAFAFVVYLISHNVIGKLYVSFDLLLTKKILKYSIPIGIASVVGTINIQLDQLLISKMYSTDEYAIYAMVSKELPVTIVATALTTVLLPRIVKLLRDDENEKAIKIWGDTTIISFAILCFIATGLFVYASDIIKLLYSSKYLPGVSVFRIYSIVLLLRCTYFGIILNSSGKTKFILYSSVASLVINIVLNYLFYYMFGFEGPAIATFVSIAGISWIQLLWSGKVLRIKMSKIFPWKPLFILLIENMLFGIAFSFIKSGLHLEFYVGSIVESVILGIVWAILYLLIMRKILIQCWVNMKGIG